MENGTLYVNTFSVAISQDGQEVIIGLSSSLPNVDMETGQVTKQEPTNFLRVIMTGTNAIELLGKMQFLFSQHPAYNMELADKEKGENV